ncbi:MAG: MazG nucleotide pyrophosphohydrolase domain-containing protein [Gammaproteobacteria bacterium]|jgi:NTP pyrophosphatase (non-canonical NTP hydrolase)
MNFETLQEVVDQWIRGHGRYWDKFEILARLTEDLGEVAATLQHTEGLRSGRDNLDLGDEIGDLLFTLAAFANVNGLRLGDCVNGVMEKYQTSDSTEW